MIYKPTIRQSNILQGQFSSLLRELNFTAPQGVYAVGGNTDVDQWQSVFDQRYITVVDTTRRVDCPRSDVCVTGLSLEDSRNTRLSVETVAERFHICLGHCPDFALGDVHADLLLAGHTHGGQVRLPFIGPPVTLSKAPRGWTNGVTHLSGGRHLFVSRGIGMERGYAPRLRFLCRPELIVIDILPE